ncbi:hypothetical protein IIA94_02985 [Patescibacteria group bacterium]|nr:hypothetical protein [Patescibacteria group bacterium]
MAMKSAFKSDKQKELFEVLSRCGELIFACGKEGVSANIVGEFIVKRYDNDEDRLDMGDGTNHVHIDWNKITKVEMGSFHGEGHEEGMLTFLIMMNRCLNYTAPRENTLKKLKT